MIKRFDNNKKVWGGSIVSLSPIYLGYLRLKYCLEDIRQLKGNVADIGCGAGGFTKAIKKNRPDLIVYGIDINKRAIEEARKKSDGVIFKIGEIYNLPFNENTLDGIVVTDVLEHIDNPEKAVKEIFRILKPGGVLHAFIPIEGSNYTLHSYLMKLGWRAKEKHAGHIQRLTYQEVKKIFDKNGFEIIDKKYSGHLLGQLTDIGYFSILDLLDRKTDVRLEFFLENKRQRNPFYSIADIFKNIVTLLINYEGLLFYFIPGFGLHLKLQKRKRN